MWKVSYELKIWNSYENDFNIYVSVHCKRSNKWFGSRHYLPPSVQPLPVNLSRAWCWATWPCVPIYMGYASYILSVRSTYLPFSEWGLYTSITGLHVSVYTYEEINCLLHMPSRLHMNRSIVCCTSRLAYMHIIYIEDYDSYAWCSSSNTAALYHC